MITYSTQDPLACNKELVLVAAEADGRVRLAHAETNDVKLSPPPPHFTSLWPRD